MRDDLTIHVVDTIDEVLELALERNLEDEKLETPQLWNPDAAASDISTTIE